MDCPYHCLGVPPTASAEQIRKAYRALALRLHPDKNAGDAGAAESFQDVAVAYAIVGDTDRRREHDQKRISPTRDGNGIIDPVSIFEEMFDLFGNLKPECFADVTFTYGTGGGGGGGGEHSEYARHPPPPPPRPASPPLPPECVIVDVCVNFHDVKFGCVKTVVAASGKVYRVKLPPAVPDGRVQRVRDGLSVRIVYEDDGQNGDTWWLDHATGHLHVTVPLELHEVLLGYSRVLNVSGLAIHAAHRGYRDPSKPAVLRGAGLPVPMMNTTRTTTSGDGACDDACDDGGCTKWRSLLSSDVMLHFSVSWPKDCNGDGQCSVAKRRFRKFYDVLAGIFVFTPSPKGVR